MNCPVCEKKGTVSRVKIKEIFTTKTVKALIVYNGYRCRACGVKFIIEDDPFKTLKEAHE